MVRTVCAVLDELRPDSPYRPHRDLIEFVKDRPGHDRRYAIDSSKIERELGWKAEVSFEKGIRETVSWYLAHQEWVSAITSGAYRDWITTQYAARGRA